MNTAPLIDYLRRPFPKAEGFSAYRFPGLIVHLPVALLFLVLGASLTLAEPYPYLWPLFLVYLVVGLYLGRDLAILAHYNLLITLAVLGGFIWLIASPDAIRALLSGARDPVLSLAITLSVAAGFCAWVRWQIGAAADKPSSESAGQTPAAPHKPQLFAAGGMWLLSLAWFALVFVAAYRPEHPRTPGLTWALWLLPLIAMAALALAFRSNAPALRNRGLRPVIVLTLKLLILLLVLAVPPAVFVTSYADFRLHARVAKMIDSVAPLKAEVLSNVFRPQGPDRAGEGIAWPADIKSDAGFIGSDGTILIFDTTVGALAIIAPGLLPDWRCRGFPRALAPRACRDYPAPTSLEDGSASSIAQAIAALTKVAAGIKATSSVPSARAARFLPRDGDLDVGYQDAQGQVALYNDRYGILMLLKLDSTASWQCRLLVQGRAEMACPAA